MATDQEVIDAKVQVNDNVVLDSALADLASIFGGAGDVNVLFERDGIVVDFKKLKSLINSGNANEVAMIAAVEASVLTSIGATEVVAGSVRKAIKDLVVAHDADIAAT